MSKNKLRPEVIEALRANQTLRLKLALENTKTEATIKNWINANDPMLTTAANLDLITTELKVPVEQVFAIEI